MADGLQADRVVEEVHLAVVVSQEEGEALVVAEVADHGNDKSKLFCFQ